MSGYIGINLTLTTNNVAYNLLTLIRAVTGYINSPGACRERTIFFPDVSGAAHVYIGGSDLSSTNYGVLLDEGMGDTVRSTKNNIPLLETYVLTDTDDSVISVQIHYE